MWENEYAKEEKPYGRPESEERTERKMEKSILTGTGVMVSKACIGTMTFGGQMAQQDALQAIDYALAQGVNFIDTANFYTAGVSEEMVGKALKGRRQDVILNTKVRLCHVGKSQPQRVVTS